MQTYQDQLWLYTSMRAGERAVKLCRRERRKREPLPAVQTPRYARLRPGQQTVMTCPTCQGEGCVRCKRRGTILIRGFHG